MTFLKTQEKLIAEIHHEFDTAQDRLLQDAIATYWTDYKMKTK